MTRLSSRPGAECECAEPLTDPDSADDFCWRCGLPIITRDEDGTPVEDDDE